jgi:hypothetical protein
MSHVNTGIGYIMAFLLLKTPFVRLYTLKRNLLLSRSSHTGSYV